MTLVEEVVRLGFANPIQEPGGIRFNGDLETLYEANLRLSMATHVLIHVANFPASTFRELCYETKKINWKQWFQQDNVIAKYLLHNTFSCLITWPPLA